MGDHKLRVKFDPVENLIDFFIEVGKLKEIPKKGWVLIGVKNPESITEHSFQVAIMAWVLGKKKKINFNIERILKMALVHDLCEVYAGDETPYDKILPKDKKEWPELFDKWPRSSKSKKIKNFLKRHKKERASLMKLISRLPLTIREEILDLWLDYERGLTKEARFVRQINRVETLFQALEYGRRSKRRPFKSWWIGSKELIDDPLLIKFMEELDKKFRPKKPRNKGT